MRQDFALDTDGDIVLADGDLQVGVSDSNHIEHIIASYPGDWKQYPSLGFGIPKELNSSLTREASRRLKIQLENDGYDINDVSIVVANSTASPEIIISNVGIDEGGQAAVDESGYYELDEN